MKSNDRLKKAGCKYEKGETSGGDQYWAWTRNGIIVGLTEEEAIAYLDRMESK